MKSTVIVLVCCLCTLTSGFFFNSTLSNSTITNSTNSSSLSNVVGLRFEVEKIPSPNVGQRNLGPRIIKTVQQPIINEQYYYRLDAGIGTPAQAVKLLIDTGSSDMWVLDANDPYCSANSINNDTYNATNEFDCTISGTFDPAKSKTFQRTPHEFYVKYGDNTFANGVFANDHFSMGDTVVTDLGFGIGTTANSSTGILGIGLPQNEATNFNNSKVASNGSFTYDNLPILLRNQGHIDRIAYSLYINQAGATEGHILFGGVDHSKYSGNLWKVPIKNLYESKHPDPPEFTVQVDDISVKSSRCAEKQSITSKPLVALLDSGTTLTYLPEETVSRLANQINATYFPDIGGYLQACNYADRGVSLTYYFGKVPISVDLRQTYFPATKKDGKPILNARGEEMCILGFNSVASHQEAILGDSFLRSAYVVFDLEKYEIALAQAVKSPQQKEDIEAIIDNIPRAQYASNYVAPVDEEPECTPEETEREKQQLLITADGEPINIDNPSNLEDSSHSLNSNPESEDEIDLSMVEGLAVASSAHRIITSIGLQLVLVVLPLFVQ
uniref:ARAD1D23562p n=1 Tax=Blastobotrys adeninivorans TaxID=409370 RepID=A0A060TFI1_BLAAD